MGASHFAELVDDVDGEEDGEGGGGAVGDEGGGIGDSDVAEVVGAITHSSAYIINIAHIPILQVQHQSMTRLAS
jgi:hypothetical protein